MSILSSGNRLLSGIAAGLFGILFISLGGWWFTLALGVIVHLGLLEFFRMAKFTGIRPATKTTLVACHLLLISTQLSVNGILPSELAFAVLPLSGAAICCWLLLQPITGSIADIASSIFGLFYLGFLPSHWLKLRNLRDISSQNGFEFSSPDSFAPMATGLFITIAVCLMIVAADIGSYFLGKHFGKKPLTPISPSKTVEGAIGGLICSILVGALCLESLGFRFGFFWGGFLGALVALFALVGDLTESMMKRSAGIKDSGDVIPGHGGILDRIDSYLFTPAVVYYIFIMMGYFLTV